MNKKAQGALEFLMTYGWAFLVILVMIGALAYFGVLSPTRFLPEKCMFASGMNCVGYKIDSSLDEIKLKLENGMGQTINIQTIDIDDPNGIIDCDQLDLILTPESMASGATSEFTIENCLADGASLTLGEKVRLTMTVNYYDNKAGSSFDHNIGGELFAEVQ